MNNLRIWSKITSVLLVPKLPLGNVVFEAPASRRTAKQGLAIKGFPSRRYHRYTQVRESGESRHFGRDAEIQAMDGNQQVVQVLDSGDLPSLSLPSEDTRASLVSHSLPSLDAGFWHPCRNDGPPTLVYNDESPSLGTCQSNDLRISIDSDRGKIYLKTLVLSLNEGRGF